MSTRIERCFTDNLYLVESIPPNLNEEKKRVYLIMGSTGNVYSVVITNKPTCTCPDFKQRKKRCKHIYFVLIRIMKVENPIIKIKYFTNENLEEMFNNIPLITNNLIVDKSKRDKFHEITNNIKSNDNNEKNKKNEKVIQKLNDEDICPICLDNLNNGKELDYCKYSCGLTLHKKCFQMWEKRNKGICVFCRADWYKNKKKNKNNSYVNLLNNERTNNNMINNSLVNDIIFNEIESDSDYNNDYEVEFVQEKRKRERSRDKDD